MVTYLSVANIRTDSTPKYVTITNGGKNLEFQVPVNPNAPALVIIEGKGVYVAPGNTLIAIAEMTASLDVVCSVLELD